MRCTGRCGTCSGNTTATRMPPLAGGPSQLLRQWDAGCVVRSCKIGADNEHHIQCMAFEILRRFIAHPHELAAIECVKDDPFALGNWCFS